MIINNVKANYKKTKEISQNINGKIRKKLVTLNVKGMDWEEKEKIIKENLIKIYSTIPNGITISKRKTSDKDNNPDGLRIFVKCNWIKRNRFHDYKGTYPLGSLLQAINRQIEGKTKENILKQQTTVKNAV